MNDTAYAPDILLALVSTATFGGWGLAGAAVVSLARHSPTVQEGVAQLRERAPALLASARGRMPELLTSTPATHTLARHEPAIIPPRPAPPRPRWLQVVNDDMDRAPHTLIVGPTGAGKTTLATAIMGDRGGRSIVITPKVSAGGWRGAEVVSLDDDGSYAPLQAALRDLEDEKRQRIVALRQHGRDGLEPLTVVFDELQDLTAHVPEAGAFMVNMASLGREIKVRMVGVGTSDEALNVRGWAASRRNYLRVELDRDRRATLNDGVRTIAVSTRESLRAAEVARLRPWRGEEPTARGVAADAPRAETVSVRVPEPAQVTSDDLLALLLDLPAEVRAQVPDISPERAARLARVMASQGVTVDGGNGQPVTVNVTQVSAPSSMGRNRVTGRGVTARERRRRLGYIDAARRGERFDPTYKRLGGNRNDMHALFTEHKTVSPH